MTTQSQPMAHEGSGSRGWIESLMRSPIFALGLRGSVPAQLHAVAPDPWPGDAERAEALYLGRFAMGEREVVAPGAAVFRLPDGADGVDAAWLDALHGFAWLRHLQADGTPLSRACAQALVSDWTVQIGTRLGHRAWQPAVAAKRLGHWLTHLPLLTDKADHATHDAVRRAVVQHARALKRFARMERDPVVGLDIALSLMLARRAVQPDGAMTWNGVEDALRRLQGDSGGLAIEGRSVRERARLLARLMQARAEGRRGEGGTEPEPFDRTIERLRDEVRTLAHPDESLAQFHGTGRVPRRFLRLLAGKGEKEARVLGFERMERGPLLCIVDAGPDGAGPSGWRSAGAFEFSLRSLDMDAALPGMRLVVSCGRPTGGNRDLALALRAAHAHSTLEARPHPDEGTDDGAAISSRNLRRAAGEEPRLEMTLPLRGGPEGIMHDRVLSLEDKPVPMLNGEDRVTGAEGGIQTRFHIHPDVEIRESGKKGRVGLHLPDGTDWVFMCFEADIAVEPTMLFAEPGGRRAAQQIVLRWDAREAPSVRWSFMQAETPKSRAR